MIDNVNFDKDIWCSSENCDIQNAIIRDFFEKLWDTSMQGQNKDTQIILDILKSYSEKDKCVINEFFYEVIYDGEVTDRDLEKGYEDVYCEWRIGTCIEDGVTKEIIFTMNTSNSPYFSWKEELDDFGFIFIDPSKPHNLDSVTINWIEKEINGLTLGSNGTVQLNDVLDILKRARGQNDS